MKRNGSENGKPGTDGTPKGNVYGYVNGEPVYDRNEFVYRMRRLGPLTDDEELVRYAEEVTRGWSHAGWKRSFTTYPLSDYALGEPRRSLTDAEFKRLKELQSERRAAEAAADAAGEWRRVETLHWADNSTEEVLEDKNGVRKTVTTVYPHGDAC